MKIRKLVTIVEETRADGRREATRPVRKAAAVAVIENPFAGRYAEDLEPLIKAGEELGALLGKHAVEALGGPVESYGKAAIVGLDGEYEHAAAILHPTLGTPFRAAVGGGAFPGVELESAGVALASADAGALAARLRRRETPAVGVVGRGRVTLDLRTVRPDEEPELARALAEAIG
jgi:hypothetical protein